MTTSDENKEETYQPEFGVEYQFGGPDDKYIFRIPAESFEDAQAKVEAIKQSAVVYGQVK